MQAVRKIRKEMPVTLHIFVMSVFVIEDALQNLGVNPNPSQPETYRLFVCQRMACDTD